MEKVQSFAKRRTHSTWAGTFSCAPQLYLEPRNLSEIKVAVSEARRLNKTIMIVGSGHSPSDMTMSSDWIMNLDKFNQIVDMRRHMKYTDVTMEAGIRIHEVNERLAEKGLALQNLGSISDQSVAGIFSTGTHGSSAYHGLVSQQVVDITLLCANGEIVKCDAQNNPDLFRALMLGLGKFGIIVYVTVRTVPAFTLATQQQAVPFEKLMKEMWPTLWTKSEFARVWWFPYSKHCIVWSADRSDHEISPRRRFSFYETVIGRFCYQAMLWGAVYICPSLTPIVERWVFRKQYLEHSQKEKYYERSDKALNMDCLFSQFVNEWAVPLTKGPEVLSQLDDIIKQAELSGEFYVHAPIEVRVSNTSKPNNNFCVAGNTLRPFLDPTPVAAGTSGTEVSYEDLTLFINATMYRPFGFNCPVGKWYRKFEDVMMAANGRPHWAKNFVGPVVEGRDEQLPSASPYNDGQMYGIKGVIDQWYGDRLKRWQQLRIEYDPQGLFLSGRGWAEKNGLIDSQVM